MHDKMTKLKELIAGDKLFPAPKRSEFVGEHYQFLVGIGDDETATITMTKEAYELLMANN